MPGPAAWVLSTYLRRGNVFQAWLYGVRANLTAAEQEQLAEALADLEQVAAEYRDWRGSAVGTAEPRMPEPAAGCDEPITVGKAADMLNISEGMVRRLCRRGDLVAEQGPGGAWAIDRESVKFYLEGRAA